MSKLFLVLGTALCLVLGANIVPASAQEIDRTQLPIPDTQYKYPGKVPLDARDAKFPPIEPLRPPKGAPNVVVILLDDIGFGAPEYVRRRHQHADNGFARQAGAALHAVPHGGPVLADSSGATHRAQPSFGGDGIDHRTRDQRARIHVDQAERDCHDRANSPHERVQHGGVRQDASDSGVGGQRFRTIHTLADRRRIREVLRVPWR